jgi:hypothetical protein
MYTTTTLQAFLKALPGELKITANFPEATVEITRFEGVRKAPEGNIHNFGSCGADTPVRVLTPLINSRSAKSQPEQGRAISPVEGYEGWGHGSAYAIIPS